MTCREHGRIDTARCNAIDQDVERRIFAGHRFGHRQNATLRRAVNRRVEYPADPPSRGTDIDDTPPLLRLHRFGGGPRQEKDRLQIDVDHAIKPFFSHVWYRDAWTYPGVVDQNIEPAKRLDDIFHQLFAI